MWVFSGPVAPLLLGRVALSQAQEKARVRRLPGSSPTLLGHCASSFVLGSKAQAAKEIFFLTFYSMLGAELINNVMIVSGKQQGTQPYIYVYPFSPRLPSHPGC